MTTIVMLVLVLMCMSMCSDMSVILNMSFNRLHENYMFLIFFCISPLSNVYEDEHDQEMMHHMCERP